MLSFFVLFLSFTLQTITLVYGQQLEGYIQDNRQNETVTVQYSAEEILLGDEAAIRIMQNAANDFGDDRLYTARVWILEPKGVRHLLTSSTNLAMTYPGEGNEDVEITDPVFFLETLGEEAPDKLCRKIQTTTAAQRSNGFIGANYIPDGVGEWQFITEVMFWYGSGGYEVSGKKVCISAPWTKETMKFIKKFTVLPGAAGATRLAARPTPEPLQSTRIPADELEVVTLLPSPTGRGFITSSASLCRAIGSIISLTLGLLTLSSIIICI